MQRSEDNLQKSEWQVVLPMNYIICRLLDCVLFFFLGEWLSLINLSDILLAKNINPLLLDFTFEYSFWWKLKLYPFNSKCKGPPNNGMGAWGKEKYYKLTINLSDQIHNSSPLRSYPFPSLEQGWGPHLSSQQVE